MGLSKTVLARVIGASNSVNIPGAVAALLQSKSGSLLLPGPSGTLRYGFQPGNYVESTGQGLTATDGAVGLVLDAAASVVGSETVFNGNFAASNSGWSSASGFTFATGSLTIVAGGGGATNNSGVAAVAGTLYFCEVVVSSRTSGTIRLVVGGTNGTSISSAGTHRFYVRAANANKPVLNCIAGGTSLVVTGVSVKPVSGVHANEATTQYKPLLKAVGGTFCLRFDADDVLDLVYPAGWESSTVVTARATGAVPQTAQNLVGAQTITGAGDWYGRLAFPAALTDGELVLVQSFANTLSEYAP